MDFFHLVSTYLAIMDQFLDWLSIFKLPKDNSDEVIKILRGYFANWGIQKEASTDGLEELCFRETQGFLVQDGSEMQAEHCLQCHFQQES